MTIRRQALDIVGKLPKLEEDPRGDGPRYLGRLPLLEDGSLDSYLVTARDVVDLVENLLWDRVRAVAAERGKATRARRGGVVRCR